MTDSNCQFCGHAAHPVGVKCGAPNPVKPCKCKAKGGSGFLQGLGNAIGEWFGNR